jgi:hypothetical protein
VQPRALRDLLTWHQAHEEQCCGPAATALSSGHLALPAGCAGNGVLPGCRGKPAVVVLVHVGCFEHGSKKLDAAYDSQKTRDEPAGRGKTGESPPLTNSVFGQTMRECPLDFLPGNGNVPAPNAATPGGCRGRSPAGCAARPRRRCGPGAPGPSTPVAPCGATSEREPSKWKVSGSVRNAGPTISLSGRSPAAAERAVVSLENTGCTRPASQWPASHIGQSGRVRAGGSDRG